MKYEIIGESVEEITKFIISKGYDTPDYDFKSFAIYTLEINMQDSEYILYNYHGSCEDTREVVIGSCMSFCEKEIVSCMTTEIEDYVEYDRKEESFSDEYVCEVAKKHCVEKNDLNYLEVYTFDKNINNVEYEYIGYKWG